MYRCLIALVVASSLVACDNSPQLTDVTAEQAALAAVTPSATPAQPVVNLLSPEVPLVTAGQPGWEYQRLVETDLDGDDTTERVVLLADAIVDQGQPLWEHGHRWQVYIEEPDGTRTHVYARFLPNGILTARLARVEVSQVPSLLLIEQIPDQLSIYEVYYRAPDQAESVALVTRVLNSSTSWSGAAEP